MRATSLLLLSVLLPFPAALPQTSDVRPIDLLDDRRESVVRVVVTNAAGQRRVGCGVVMDGAGTIATAYELVREAVAARVDLASGTSFDRVTVLSTDGQVALLRVEASGLRRLKLADADDLLPVKTTVLVLGGPGGSGRILAGGRIVGASFRKPAPNEKSQLIQHHVTAPLLVTNWGGPAFSTKGEPLGIITPVMRPLAGETRHGLAPGRAIRELLEETSKASPEGKRLSPLGGAEPPAPRRRPSKEVIAEARTIAVSVVLGPETLQPALAAGVGTSIPWRLVPDPIDADLVLLVDAMEITFRVGLGEAGRQYEVTASLRDARTGDEVWSTRKGQSRSSSPTPFDQIASRIVATMKESFGAIVVPTAPEQKPETPGAGPPPAGVAPALLLEDLPAGFLALPPEDLKKLGMTPDGFAAFGKCWSAAAPLIRHSGFIDPRDFQVVVGLVFSPVSPLEAAAVHMQLASPDAAVKSFQSGPPIGPVGQFTVIPGLDVFADRSQGLTATMTRGALAVRWDIVVAIRGTALEIVLSMYRDGAKPTAGAAEIARALDARTAAALK
jgi:hypothetical protein